MKLSTAEKAVIGIALLAAAFTLGFFAGRSGGGGERFVVETEKQITEVSPGISENSGNADISSALPEDKADVSQKSGDNVSDELININTADSELLQTLPGIGEKLAGRIIAYREENGGFAITDEIMDVEGVGEKIFENIKDLITVDSG